jgi:DNA-directed RNA polymerase omega subunit
MERIPERVDSTFRFILIAANRAEQLMRGARPRIDVAQPTKPTRIALREVAEDLVDWDYGPPPMPVEEPVAEAEGGEATEAGG